MARTRSRFALALTSSATALALVWSGASFAQDPPKDEALDKLLEKLEGNTTPAPATEPAPKPKDAKKDDAKKDKAAPKDKPKDKDKPKPAEEPEDKTLDGLLEKLGETKEAPETTGPASAPKPDGGDSMPQPKPEDASADKLKDSEKPLDEHLEDLTGRIRKKKPQDGQQGQPGEQGQQGEADENSPIGQAVKKMREVETKLGETDTGEETRKKQGEIIKDLEQLIAQAKKQQQQGQGQGKRRGSKPGQQQPGDQPGDQPGTDPNARGAGPMANKKPTDKPILVGGKDIWGNLPAMMREDMENVFSTQPLPRKSRQISRYYESLAKKGSAASRGNP